MKRGDIYLTDFNSAKGGEIGKLRPAIVLSGEEECKALATVIVVPLSTTLVDDAKPYRMRITKREKLKTDSDACIYEIRALSKPRLKEKVAELSPAEYEEMKGCLCGVV
jgi:mRNA interferase MazF